MRLSGRHQRCPCWASLACALATIGLALAGPAAASPGQETIFDAPHELIDNRNGLREHTLDELQAMGVDTVRVLMYWRSVAPHRNATTKPGRPFDASDASTYPAEKWIGYDGAIAAAKARGLKVLLTPTGPIPRWASSSGDSADDPKPREFEAFVRAVGTRYSGSYRPPLLPLSQATLAQLPGVDEWSIWNEPNIPYFLGPQYRNGRPYSPRLYRRLYSAGRRALVATGNGGDTILIGETAARGGPRGVSPLRFLRGALCLSEAYVRKPGCSSLEADGWATHPYTTRLAPTEAPRRRDDVTIGSLDRLSSALDRAGAAGALPDRLPIHVTEFGVQTLPDPWVGVGLQRQAEIRSLSEWIAFRNPRVRSFAQYLMRDDPPDWSTIRYGGFESGLRTAGGRRKPAYAEFRTPLVVLRRGDRVRIWGLVRPAEAGQRVAVEARDRGGRPWTAAEVETDPRSYTAAGDYRAGRRWRAVWRPPATDIAYAGPWIRAR